MPQARKKKRQRPASKSRSGGGGGGGGRTGVKPPSAEEKALASELFGTALSADTFQVTSTATAATADASTKRSRKRQRGVDGGGAGGGAGAGAGASASDAAGTGNGDADGGGGAAWADSDDENVQVDIGAVNRLRKLRTEAEADADSATISGAEYQRRLRKQFKSMHGTQRWADLSSEPQEDSASIVRTAGALTLASSRTVLRKGRIDMSRMKDANARSISKSVVQSVRFHPVGQVMLTAGFDKRLRLFQVDGVENKKIQSVFFADMPIRTARFTGDGSQIVVSGRRPFFYTFDVTSGRVSKISNIIGRREKSWERFEASPDGQYLAFLGNDGYTVLVSAKTKQWVANLKMNGSVRAIAFNKANSNEMFTTGGDGEVYRWDLRMNKPTVRHMNEAGSTSTSIAVSHNGQHYAVGASSGVVNLYSSSTDSASAADYASPFGPGAGSSAVTPMKTFMHLTTGVDTLEFNHDSCILAMGSHRKKDSLKLVHVPTLSVFANWPTNKTPISYLYDVTFSPNSGFLAMGNDRGRALLYRLNHYLTA